MIAHHQPLLQGITDIFGSIAAISTGSAALISAILSVRVTRKRAENDCDRRLAETWSAFREGLDLADQRPKRRPRKTAE